MWIRNRCAPSSGTRRQAFMKHGAKIVALLLVPRELARRFRVMTALPVTLRRPLGSAGEINDVNGNGSD